MSIKKVLNVIKEIDSDLKIVDHLINTTYYLIKDEKIFIQIIYNLSEIIEKIVNVSLLYECLKIKKESSNNFSVNYPIYKKISKKFKISKEEIEIIEEILMLKAKHKESPTDFIRDKSFIILEDDLSFKKITFSSLKEYLFKVGKIVNKTQIHIKTPL